MSKKLTIEVDEQLADRIERIARRRRQSVSDLTSSLYRTLITTEIDDKLAPITSRYKGIIPPTEIDDRVAAAEHLARKHG